MRKLFHSLFILGSLLALASCSKDPDVIIRVVDITVYENNWNYTNTENNNYFYAEVDAPEISEYAFDNGIIKMYRTYDYDSINASQVELPYVRPIEYYNYVTDQWFNYTEQVDYEYSIGKLRIFFTESDFNYEVSPDYDNPGPMRFRLVVMY